MTACAANRNWQIVPGSCFFDKKNNIYLKYDFQLNVDKINKLIFNIFYDFMQSYKIAQKWPFGGIFSKISLDLFLKF